MKKNIALLLIMILVSSTVTMGQATSSGDGEKSFKVMGYFSESPFNAPIDESIQFEGLTHLLYAFVKPNADGTLMPILKPARLKELVQKSHAKNVKVVIAVGGINNGTQKMVTLFEAMAASDAATATFVKAISKFVDDYSLDGVEIDWEYPSEASKLNYEKLMVALKNELHPKWKTLSAAVAGAISNTTTQISVSALTDQSLACMDWVNIMAYDLGSGLFGQQSPYWFADSSIDYYLYRHVPAEKIILGLPLFARPSWKQYRDLVKLDKNNAYKDYVPGEKLDSYYNGLSLISAKTRLALKQAGGIMFFDINEDTHDDTSAQKASLRMIQTYQEKKLSDLYIVLDNREMVFKSELGLPFIDNNGRTQIPVRQAMEAIGAVVTYDATSDSVTVEKDGKSLQLTIGSPIMLVNGVATHLDTTPMIKKDRTYLPLRALYEQFGYEMTYYDSSNAIFISKVAAAK